VAKREQIGRDKEVRIRIGRKGLTLAEQQRFIIEGLPMVGPLLAKSLLEKFGSIKQIVNANEKELQEVENLGKKKARIIQKVLLEKYDDKKLLYESEEEIPLEENVTEEAETIINKEPTED
ncbi:MAG: helix-hairpin-helix domain-containing protein, partial [archaeon]